MEVNPKDDEFADRINRECSEEDETEENHNAADRILCELLTQLGFVKTVAAFEEVGKWYG